ncbi:hypothetical protein Slin15195_G037460 [Septoria linicola]|uniref:LDB19 N-terminal domain-containing protein n=1 Tax=Septoria linicola TaxID=215465 RepID=A0A9Q9AQW6_9PEZI|nr:hypothetical protein Slin14017_G118870 [Septoria linicola]USW50427.1 hypothetical protein Slin15195_G037460 [Septoria linicola]
MPSKIFGIWSAPTSPLQLDNNLPTYQQSNKPASSNSLEVRRLSMDHIKRPTLFAKKQSSHEKAKSKERSISKDKNARDGARSPAAPKPVKLGLLMESPPILMLDAPSQSSGALISGRLQITPNLPEATLSSLIMFLECTTTTKRPVQDRCRECMSQVNDLFEWHFLAQPKTLKAKDGMYEMPFSQVIPGHIPATTHGSITSIDYQLHVRARSVDGQEIEFRRELVIKRALRPGNDKNSVRVFPPTNLTLHVTLPNVVHTNGEFNVMCRMTGITTKREETQTRWRLRKLTWRVEEHETAISPACSAHASKIGGEGKGVEHQNTRDIGYEELKQGWKTDFSEGEIEGEFAASINPTSRANCGITSPNGTTVKHNMIMELVIAEEWAPNKKPGQATPTGAARVLRTQFALNVTERAGMGIAWDDEQPPMYEDVPDSPPQYPNSYQGDRSAWIESQRGMAGPSSRVPPGYEASASSGQNSPHNTEIVDYEGPDLNQDIEQMSLEG